MRQTLRQLRAAMAPPKASHADGMLVVATGDHVTQFPSEDAARFHLEAYAAVPVLLAQLEDLERHTDTGTIARMAEDLVALERDRDTLAIRVATLEQRITAEVAVRTRAQHQARAGAIVARKTLDVVRRAAALQRELDAERAKPKKSS